MSSYVHELNIQDTSYRRTCTYTLRGSKSNGRKIVNGNAHIHPNQATKSSTAETTSNGCANGDMIAKRNVFQTKYRPIDRFPDIPLQETTSGHIQTHRNVPWWVCVWRKIVRGFSSTLLPGGYPETVRTGYGRYQILDGIQVGLKT